MNVSRQGSDPVRANNDRNNATMLNKSGTLNKSNGGPEDDLALSMEETDFNVSESNFSHSMMSNKIGAFAGNPAAAAQNSQSFKANAGRDRAATQATKPYRTQMSKNLIPEDDEELVDETEGLGTSSKKGKGGDNDDDNDDEDYSDDFD